MTMTPMLPGSVPVHAASDPVRPETGLRLTGRVGVVAAVALLAVFGFWAYATEIDSAVATQGQVVVRGKPKTVQSLDGGVVEEILVHNGDRVEEGQLLMRLDPTLIRVNLDIARTRLAEASARKARLEAEDRGLAAPVFTYPPLPFERPPMAEPEAGQMRVFEARQHLNTGRRAQLGEKLEQFRRQIDGLEASITAKAEQLGYIEQELANSRKLFDQGLMREPQILQLQRARAEMKGTLAEAEADRARVGNAMQDAIIEVDQAERQFREDVVTDLRSTQTEIEESTIQIVTLSRQLERVDIRAPSTGIVHEMQVTTLGGVVPPNGTILQVIPVDDGVELELMLEPREIDRVHPGQKAEVLFTAFDHRATPRLEAHVTQISPTVVSTGTQGGTERNFYRLGLELEPGQLERLNEKSSAIVPGMPIEAFLETGEHTVMSYLVQPLVSQIMHAFRER
ncbi:HlyD family type I secretion periplasmic adaptor subunit [Haematobacter massiliensis]|uniref:Membrane fusion protein (MFP) family protein n=1 Tax=Haematobacter massiliensis TaxID=195105 RepID=A0A086XY99_9RHOB|nr:HlyD family type I secretion periplasmic adaptor subunit [Haematobacter massiliensis]KFI26999.1 hemolysin D [Haematobacter massiliensis]OWJ69595.1 HlyD family type I secretion periplasmic adaptor subunit [Haematobacter massiliensis]OWJ88369.1 HlyD family type I secretion periplasmic adaptor subunit [Haematobacter massiliensis]QBJ22805.1 HlyD family type I secretion periplasmic adaptor subunit [Haematobacter massiliensis]